MKILKNYFERKKFQNALSTAELEFTKIKRGEKFTQRPSILKIHKKPEKTTFVFRLPSGVNPAEVKKKIYVFQAIYGENIEVKNETSTVYLTVYNTVFNQSYPFVLSEWTQYMCKLRLPIVGGKDINGKLHVYDMIENPHLLIAGETGSGKSVMLRTIISSLILHKRKGLELHLADLKRSEFHLFRGVDIVKSVATRREDVVRLILGIHSELEKRGELLDVNEVEHIDKYNELPNVERKNYILLCIDEFSILRDEKEAMEALKDISSLGRALGIFLILSTQRPDRTIIDGILKANLTVRYAFRHADKLNSRITLGDGHKEDASTIGEDEKGRFFMRNGKILYLQSPFLDADDAKKLLKGYKTRKPENVIDAEFCEIEDSIELPEGVKKL